MNNENNNKNEIISSDSNLLKKGDNNNIVADADKEVTGYSFQKRDFKKILITLLSFLIAISVLIGTYFLLTREKKETVIDKTCFSTNNEQTFIYDNEILISVPSFFLEDNSKLTVNRYSKYPTGRFGFLKFAKKPKNSKILTLYDLDFANVEKFDDILEVSLSYDPAMLYENNEKNTISAVYLDEKTDTFKTLPSIIEENKNQIKVFLDKPCMIGLSINFNNDYLPYTFETPSDEALFLLALKETAKKPDENTCIYAFDSLISSFDLNGPIDTFYEESKKLPSLKKFENDFTKLGEYMLYEDISKRIVKSKITKETISLMENTDNDFLTTLAMNGILSQYYIDLDLTKETIKPEEKIYEESFSLYFKENMELTTMEYYRVIKGFHKDSSTSRQFKESLDMFITDLVYSFWDDVKNVATYQAKIEKEKEADPLTEKTMNKISENAKKQLLEDINPILTAIMTQSQNLFGYDAFLIKEDIVYSLFEPADINVVFDAPKERLEKGIEIFITDSFENTKYVTKSTTDDKISIDYSVLEYLINNKADNMIVTIEEQNGQKRNISKAIPNLAPRKTIKMTYIIEPFISLDPQKKTLSPGGEVSFIAKRGKNTVSNVTYEADGGQISSNGNFVAPKELGMYTITAHSTNQYGYDEVTQAYVYVE